MPKILIVDDQHNMCRTIAMLLRSQQYEVEEAVSAEAAIELGTKGAFDLVLTDLKLGEHDGIEVLRAIREESPLTEVIVMTAFATIESAVQAMRLGAFDYIQKPFSEQELLVKTAKAIENRRLSSTISLMASDFRERYHFESIIGRSQVIRDVLGRIVRIAPTDATVLITGESGTGKELVARAIHANSKRAQRPFIPVNCAAITETLLESELFGHAKGSFTGAMIARKGLFEEAEGGTFFFDEISETPLSFQAKLLRVIQEGEIRRIGENKSISIDVRIIAATNQDLSEMIAQKRFRQDLYYRLNVARFQLPPLRERREDIPMLAEFFLDQFCRKMNVKSRFAEGVVETLMTHPFPGNIRELENLIEQAVALVGDGLIQKHDLSLATKEYKFFDRTKSSRRTLADVVDDAEKEAIEATLHEYEGAREKVAATLGISQTTLWRKMTRLNINY